MSKLLERNIETVDQRLVLLAPSGASALPLFRHVETDLDLHRSFVRDMQVLRGNIYLRDGALERRRLAPDGRHRTPEDEKSWHLLMVDKDQQVSACVWYFAHKADVTFESLRVRNNPLGRTESRGVFRNAVESEIASARAEGLGYAEIGGWAAKENGCSSEGLILALAGFSLSRVLGGSLGLTTATSRHKSSTILRRLGGSSLEFNGDTIAPYFDPTYRCMMELLRFDSRTPNDRYVGLIELLRERLTSVRVISKPAGADTAVDYTALRRRPVTEEVPLGLEVPSDWAQPSAVVPGLAVA
jgi:hypothetical protein